MKFLNVITRLEFSGADLMIVVFAIVGTAGTPLWLSALVFAAIGAGVSWERCWLRPRIERRMAPPATPAPPAPQDAL